jgi:hypothetical protein
VDAPPAVELAWIRGAGAESCIDEGELASKVQATIGHPVVPVPALANAAAPAEASPLRLEGEVRPLGRGWIAVVEVRAAGPSLRREVALDAPDCRQFDEGLVLVVALLTEAVLPTAPRLTLTLPSPSPRASVGIGPDLSVALGMLPGVAVGFGLATEAALPPIWHLTAWTHAWPISSAALDGTSVGRVTAWTLGAGLCIGPAERAPRAFFGCAGASGGVVFATGVGLSANYTSLNPYVQGELRGGFRLRLAGPFYVRLEVGAGLPIPESYEIIDTKGNHRVVFQTAPVVGLGRFAVEFRAP